MNKHILWERRRRTGGYVEDKQAGGERAGGNGSRRTGGFKGQIKGILLSSKATVVLGQVSSKIGCPLGF